MYKPQRIFRWFMYTGLVLAGVLMHRMVGIDAVPAVQLTRPDFSKGIARPAPRNVRIYAHFHS